MRRNRLVILLVGLLLFLAVASTALAQSLAGAVIDRWSKPVPGLSVLLIHPSTGISFQAWTDGGGRFFFQNIPAKSDYTLQVFWGPNLAFERTVVVSGRVNIGVIRLP